MDTVTVWQETQTILSRQMTQAAYAAHIAPASLASVYANGEATATAEIVAGSAQSGEFLDKRLRGKIETALAATLERPVRISVVFRENGHDESQTLAPPPVDQPTASDRPQTESLGLRVARADYFAAHYRGGGSGYNMLSHYANQFWRPYLGDAFGLWSRLAAEKRATTRRPADRWTEPDRYSYSQLAGWLGLSHSRYISGYPPECGRSREHVQETGQQIPECCGNHWPARVRLDREKRERCHYWKPGLLEILHHEQLAAVAERKAGRGQGIRSHRLEVQVWRELPILTPAQVSRLNSELRTIHKNWLNDFGHLVGLGVEPPAEPVDLWREIEEETLVDLMDGYQEYRQLDGPFQPDGKFLKLRLQVLRQQRRKTTGGQ